MPIRFKVALFTKLQRFLGQPVLLRRMTGRAGAERMKEEERRLVWRVLRYWKAHGGRFPHRDEIDPWLPGEDGANCRLIAVRGPIADRAFAFRRGRGELGSRSLQLPTPWPAFSGHVSRGCCRRVAA